MPQLEKWLADPEVVYGETGHLSKRFVILEFESNERARKWYGSQEYSAAKEVRQKSAVTSAFIVEGAS